MLLSNTVSIRLTELFLVATDALPAERRLTTVGAAPLRLLPPPSESPSFDVALVARTSCDVFSSPDSIASREKSEDR